MLLQGPAMVRAHEESQFIREEWVKIQLLLVFWFEHDSKVDLVGSQKVERFGGVAGLDADQRGRILLLKIAQHRRQNILASGGAGANAQAAASPFAQLLERRAGRAHFL